MQYKLKDYSPLFEFHQLYFFARDIVVGKSLPFAAGSSEMHTVRFAFGMSKVVDIKNFGKPDKIANDITNKTNVFE